MTVGEVNASLLGETATVNGHAGSLEHIEHSRIAGEVSSRAEIWDRARAAQWVFGPLPGDTPVEVAL
ncbi:MAG: hypothetical protein ACRCYU_12685 [Nocardioides sp.]